MRKICLFLSLCCALSFVSAQKALPGNMYFSKLANGLEVLVVEDNSVPLVTIDMAVKNGAYTESPEFNGLSHLYEHLFFQENKDFPNAEAFARRRQELGISLNGTTSNEKVEYYFTLPNYNFTEGLKLMSSAIRYPIFSKQEIKHENLIVDAEFQRNESNPFFTLSTAMGRHLWGELYCRKNPIGDHEIIRNADADKMNIIRNKYYWPNNSLLIIAGDIKKNEVMVDVMNILGPWEASGFDPFEKYPVPEMKPIEKNDYVVVESPNAKQPYILIQWQGPDTRRDIPNTYVADILSFILEQNASKMHKALVESGLASGFSANYLTEKYSGPVSFSIVPNPGKIRECFDAFYQQISLLDLDDYFSDEQLAVAKRLYEIRQIHEQEVSSAFVHSISYWWCSASIDYFNTYQDNLNKVSREDIRNYIRKYIKGKPHCSGLLINPETRKVLEPEKFMPNY